MPLHQVGALLIMTLEKILIEPLIFLTLPLVDAL